VYLDYASATPVLPNVIETMTRAMGTFGNPGSIHQEGVAAANLLKDSRARIAEQIGCKAREMIFTSGGTEANNLAILGFAKSLEREVVPRSGLGKARGPTSALSGTHWIVSSIEHPSVLECFAEIELRGGHVDFVDPDSLGIIQPERVKRLLRTETIFVSIGWANGEIGVVQPIARIKEVLRAHEETNQTIVLLHSDAGQAPLYDGAHVHSLGLDILTLDSGKLYGPRGIGALYISNRVKLSAIQLGGSQERGLRAGTENVVLAVGFAESFAAIARERQSESKRLQVFRETLEKGLRNGIAGIVVNGDLKRSLPHMLNISIPGIDSEYLTLALDNNLIAVSTKSACREGEHQKSHVVALLGGDEWRARNTLRFSLGRDTHAHDIDRVIHTLVQFCATHTE